MSLVVIVVMPGIETESFGSLRRNLNNKRYPWVAGSNDTSILRAREGEWGSNLGEA